MKKTGQVLYSICKRLIDIVLGIIGTAMFLVIYLFVKLAFLASGDADTVMFTQERIGYHGKKIKIFKKKIDYKEQGGAVLMGISKPVIKAHGSSDAKAFFNAIRQAKLCVEQKVIESISESLEILEKKSNTEQV